MDPNRSQMTGVLNLTLEIIYMLTGEDYAVVKKSSREYDTYGSERLKATQNPITELPPNSLLQGRTNDKKILELTNKIIHLLTGQVWQYLEGHTNLYKYVMMENRQLRTSFDLSENRKNKEPGSHEDGRFIDIEMYTPTDYTPIKEEPHSCDEEDFTDNHKRSNPVPIKVEPTSYVERNLASHDISTSIDHVQPDLYPQVKKEPCANAAFMDSHDNAPECYSELDYTRNPISENLEEGCRPHIMDGDISDFTSPTDVDEQQSENKVPYRSLLTANQATATGKEQYSCSEHSSLLSDQSNLAKSSKHQSEMKIFTCLVCHKCFSTKVGLFRHQITHVGQEKKVNNSLDFGRNQTISSSVTELINGKRLITSIEECEVNPVAGIYQICQHQKFLAGQSDDQGDLSNPFCVECGEVFALDSQAQSHFSCSECAKCFASSPHLIAHERIHTGEKSFVCTVCCKRFATKSTLVIHQRIHTREKPYSCTECQRRFPCNSQLIIHKRTHTGEKPYSCSDCGKGFISNSDLLRHKRIHTGERPFKCSECGKCFSQKPHLREHYKTHRK